MAFPAVETTAESITATAGTSHTVTLPTGIVAGDLLVVFFAIGSVAATVNALAGWTELVDAGVAAGTVILVRTADGSEGASISLTTSASTRDASIVYRISGAENISTQLPELSTVTTGTSISPDPGTCTPTGGAKDYLWIAQFSDAGEEADDDTWCNSAPTNYTGLLQKACGIAGTSLAGINATASRQLNAASENPGTFNQDASLVWRAFTVAVHPTSSSPQNVSVTGLTSSSSYGAVTATPGNVNVSVSGRTSASSFGAITLVTGNVDVAVAGRTSVSSYGTVTEGGTGPQTVAVTGRTSTSSYGSITATPGGITAEVAGRTSVSSFGTPTPIPGAVVVTVAGRTSVSSFGVTSTGDILAVIYVCWDQENRIVRGYGDTEAEAEAAWRNHLVKAGTHGSIEERHEIFTATKE